jgi:hypothetical protein
MFLIQNADSGHYLVFGNVSAAPEWTPHPERATRYPDISHALAAFYTLPFRLAVFITLSSPSQSTNHWGKLVGKGVVFESGKVAPFQLLEFKEITQPAPPPIEFQRVVR